MGILYDRRLVAPKNLIVIPHMQCGGNCQFCFLDKTKDRPVDLKKTISETYKYMITSDSIREIFLHGGELFQDKLVQDREYSQDLVNIVKLLFTLKDPECTLSVPISLENVSDIGIDLYLHLKEAYNIRCNVSFVESRVNSRERMETYFSNLKRIKHIVHSLNVLSFPGTLSSEYITEIKGILPDLRINYEEPMVLDMDLAFNYGSTVNVKPMSKDIQCLCHCTDIVTSFGTQSCMGITRKPEWIEESEWNRLSTSNEYRTTGYQQVIDWYGCDTCQKQSECPGMCWISYYAQRIIYNNRQCLYAKRSK